MEGGGDGERGWRPAGTTGDGATAPGRRSARVKGNGAAGSGGQEGRPEDGGRGRGGRSRCWPARPEPAGEVVVGEGMACRRGGGGVLWIDSTEGRDTERDRDGGQGWVGCQEDKEDKAEREREWWWGRGHGAWGEWYFAL
ncbi:hypothetical protein TRIUR3_31108 [Triticum urartu]|uniref:Uncharacterized protein n=1 Tax=Triticum urartu TaxID=4572 RepID=M7ZS46_TRIUA|nr:hypothetical protein TRIUR3_31108 [Triticum urartu]